MGKGRSGVGRSRAMARAREVDGVHTQQQDEVGRKEYVSGGYSIVSNRFIWGKVMAGGLCLKKG